MLILHGCVSELLPFFVEIFCVTAIIIAVFGFIIRLWITIVILHLFVYVLADADQDRWNSHVLPTPAATTPPPTAAAMPAAPAPAVPAAPAVSGKFRRCQCGRRMSSLSYDHHSVLLFVWGF